MIEIFGRQKNGRMCSFIIVCQYYQSFEVPNFEVYLKHWALLVEAVHLLLKDCISMAELRKAHELLIQFVASTELYYTADAMNFNVHQLTHLAQSVVDWGPLWAHCGYQFESSNGKILDMVHAAKGVLNQVCRSLLRNTSIVILQRHVITERRNSPINDYCDSLDNRYTKSTEKSACARYFGRATRAKRRFIEELNLSEMHTKTYHRMVKNNCLFKTCKKQCHRSNNSIAQTTGGLFIQIMEFIVDATNNKEYAVYKEVKVQNCFSEECTTVKLVVSISNDENVIETNNVAKLCVLMDINNVKYISAVPNMYWIS